MEPAVVTAVIVGLIAVIIAIFTGTKVFVFTLSSGIIRLTIGLCSALYLYVWWGMELYEKFSFGEFGNRMVVYSLLTCSVMTFVLIPFGITLATGRVWPYIWGGGSLANVSAMAMPWLEGLLAWFCGTFVFYWWHRLRHRPGFWLVFYQVHHSPSRIEIVTSFYKHPIEIFTNAVLSGVLMYGALGSSTLGAFWYNFFAATGEYFYHANLRSPWWLRYLIQTPELHSIHHQYEVHRYNYGDLPLWDRLFGTYRDATEFAPRCGFPAGAESRLSEMLLFRDVYDRETV